MPYLYRHDLISSAKTLRKHMTKQERHLWYDFLKTYPVRFCRQKMLGNYIVDFYCAKAKLVVELDGSQHYETAVHQYDQQRTAFLNNLGITVIRIPNNDVTFHFERVCAYIDLIVNQLLTEK